VASRLATVRVSFGLRLRLGNNGGGGLFCKAVLNTLLMLVVVVVFNELDQSAKLLGKEGTLNPHFDWPKMLYFNCCHRASLCRHWHRYRHHHFYLHIRHYTSDWPESKARFDFFSRLRCCWSQSRLHST
jgi:hypothetical protein